MFKNYKEKFDKDGYYKIENFLTREEVAKIIEEINNFKDVDVYTDRSNKIRRIERVYDKGDILKKVNTRYP